MLYPRVTRMESVTMPAGGPPEPEQDHRSEHPRVTIGIPTFNRATSLSRAVASCRAQTYPSLEIVISDNASTDATAQLCESWAESDGRVVFIRQPENLGREPNFRAVLEAASGFYFMWLSDDDWLDHDYVTACVAGLVSEPTSALVGGAARYHLPDGTTHDDSAISLLNSRAEQRVVGYMATVTLNGTYYGVMRRADAWRVEYPITLSGDWYFVAQMAALGTVLLLPEVVLHRSIGGNSTDMPALAASYGVRARWAQDVHLWALFLLAPSLARGRGSFALIPARRRVVAALRLCAVLVGRWWRYTGRARLGRLARPG